MPTGLMRLIYFSECSDAKAVDVDKILEISRRNNKEKGITGFLVFDGQYFVQVLEGGRRVVSDLYLKIAGDGRHNNVVLVGFQQISERGFTNWSMGFFDAASAGRDWALPFCASKYFKPFEMTYPTLVSAMSSIAQQQKTDAAK